MPRRGQFPDDMAIVHRAWTFNAPEAARAIAALHASGGPPALRSAAHEVVMQAVPETAVALADLHFDREWIDPPDQWSDRMVESVIILLASRFSRAPAVSARTGGHVVLQKVLATLGWSAADLELLLRGWPLEVLFSAYQAPELAADAAGIGQYGGWIPREEAPVILSRLDEAVAAARAQHGDVPGMHVLEDARQMLETARRREADLFVVLD